MQEHTTTHELATYGHEGPVVDGYSVHVPNAHREEVLAVYEGLGLDPIDLDGATGDDTERDVGVGSIDGDEPQALARFADVLDELDGMRVPYSARVMCAGPGQYRATLAYMLTRSRIEIRPTFRPDGRHKGFTPGHYEAATSY